MNAADMVAMVDQIRRNLTPTRQLIFTVTSGGVVTIHKQYGWRVPLDTDDIVLAGGTLVVTSRGEEFAAAGLFVQVNTNANYSWTNAGELRVTAVFGSQGFMSIKITGEL